MVSKLWFALIFCSCCCSCVCICICIYICVCIYKINREGAGIEWLLWWWGGQQTLVCIHTTFAKLAGTQPCGQKQPRPFICFSVSVCFLDFWLHLIQSWFILLQLFKIRTLLAPKYVKNKNHGFYRAAMQYNCMIWQKKHEKIFSNPDKNSCKN